MPLDLPEATMRTARGFWGAYGRHLSDPAAKEADMAMRTTRPQTGPAISAMPPQHMALAVMGGDPNASGAATAAPPSVRPQRLRLAIDQA